MIMKKNSKFQAFTLIEILISLTILSIIMVSVMMIFINSINLSAKSEINRMMQENIKNIVETIWEDVRKNWIFGVSENIIDSCNFTSNVSSFYKKWDKLCTKWSNDYYLAKNILWIMKRVDSSECLNLEDNCRIVKNWEPISNSHVSIKDLKFFISDDFVPKVTINIVMQPSLKKWVRSKLIKENKMIFQTTISTRIF